MSRKPPATSKISKIDRPSPVAYARRMKTGAEIDDDAADPVTKDESKKTPEPAAPPKDAAPSADASKVTGNAGATTGDASKAAANAGATDPAKASAATNDSSKAAAGDSSKAAGNAGTTTTAATGDSSKAAAVTTAAVPSEASTRPTAPIAVLEGEAPKLPPQGERSRADTLVMPMVSGFGAPPAVPTVVAAAPRASQGAVEDPTHMPSPREIPGGQPTDPAAPPGRVPRGDSRSLRRADEFALVYRVATFVISRFGSVGQRGQWRVVEYPTSSSASHAYAKECSRFVTEGFSDYRD